MNTLRVGQTVEHLFLRETLFKTEDEIGAETLALHFIATVREKKTVFFDLL